MAWRQAADFCNRYLAKGRKVAVEGSIQTRTYDAQDGSKRYVTEIIADSVESLDARDDADKPGRAPRDETPEQSPSNEQFTEVDDDELPF